MNIRQSFWNAIQAGADAAVAANPQPLAVLKALPCPCCNYIPSIEDGFHGQFVVFCDNSDCSGYGEKQAMGKTAVEAITLWNEREALEAIGCGSMK